MWLSQITNFVKCEHEKCFDIFATLVVFYNVDELALPSPGIQTFFNRTSWDLLNPRGTYVICIIIERWLQEDNGPIVWPSQEKNSLASTNDLRPFICGFVWTQKENGNPEIDLTSDLLSADWSTNFDFVIFFVY